MPDQAPPIVVRRKRTPRRREDARATMKRLGHVFTPAAPATEPPAPPAPSEETVRPVSRKGRPRSWAVPTGTFTHLALLPPTAPGSRFARPLASVGPAKSREEGRKRGLTRKVLDPKLSER